MESALGVVRLLGYPLRKSQTSAPETRSTLEAVLTDSLVVGSFTPSVLLAVARRVGQFAEARLEVQEVLVTSSPAQFRSLLAGELDLALTSPDNVLAYRFSPSNPLGRLMDARILSTVDRGLGLSLWARAGLDSAAAHAASALRGARLAVDVPNSGFALAMYTIAESLGLGREEYEVIALGSTPQRLRALAAGQCDATMLNAGNQLLAERDGCGLVATVADVCSPYVGTVTCVVGGQVRDSARRFAAAMHATASRIAAGHLDKETASAAAAVMGLGNSAAERFVDMLKDPREGLIVHTSMDAEGLRTIVNLRIGHSPEVSPDASGPDVLAGALEPESGLLSYP